MKKYILGYVILFIAYVFYFVSRALKGGQSSSMDALIIGGGFAVLFCLFFILAWFLPKYQNVKSLRKFAKDHGFSIVPRLEKLPGSFDTIDYLALNLENPLKGVRIRALASPSNVIISEKGIKIFLDMPTFVWYGLFGQGWQWPSLGFLFETQELRGRHKIIHRPAVEICGFKAIGPLAKISGLPLNLEQVEIGEPWGQRLIALSNNEAEMKIILGRIQGQLSKLSAVTSGFFTINLQNFEIDISGTQILVRFNTRLAQQLDSIYPIIVELRDALASPSV